MYDTGFRDSFVQLIEENEGMKLNEFFTLCRDSYEDEDEQRFIKWFSEAFKNKHVTRLEAEIVLPLFEDHIDHWEKELKFNNESQE